MNKRKLLLGLAALSSVTALLYFSDFRHPTVLQVTQDLPRGTKIEANMLAQTEVLKKTEVMMDDRSEVLGQYLTIDVKAGEYVHSAKLSKDPLVKFTGDEGIYGIPVTIDSSVGWKLTTGDLVTIIWFDRTTKESRPVMMNITVDSLISQGGKEASKLQEEEDKNVVVANIKVTPAQAAELDKFKNTGSLSLLKQSEVSR